jgi:uncharacterized protein YdcH (DUF465 family)
MIERETLVERLTQDNEEFRRLREEHQRCERELADLNGRPFLTADQQWRRSELKKLKLIAKDRGAALLRQASKSAEATA